MDRGATTPVHSGNGSREGSSLKMSTGRLALLTGTLPRPKPYDVGLRFSSNRRTTQDRILSLSSSEKSKATLNLGVPDFPATASILKGVKNNEGASSPDKPKQTIDWQVVNREAEITRLSTEVNKLQSLLDFKKNSEEELRINNEKTVSELNRQLEQERNKIIALEHELKLLEVKYESLSNEKDAAQENMNELSDALEKKAQSYQLENTKLSSKVRDLEGELETLKAKHQTKLVELNYAVKLLQTDLDKEVREKQILTARLNVMHSQMVDTAQLERKLKQAEDINLKMKRELELKTEDSNIRRLMQEEIKELQELRAEKDESTKMITSQAQDVEKTE
ncbi:hypothetical protein HDE_02432 [Halotydeus destructor]|nr:hypothetical protein HDE_02432 [Halotydeus destructor]